MLRDLSRLVFILLASVSVCIPSCYRNCPPPPCQHFPSEALQEAICAVAADPTLSLDEEIPPDWWGLFGDPQLAQFIEQALCCNPTVELAQARIIAAQAEANQARAALIPEIFGTSSAQYNELSKTALVPSNTTPAGAPLIGPGVPFYFTLYSAAVNFYYDFDFWCKNRNTWRAALDRVRARMADEAFVRLTLSIAVADVYFRLQLLHERLQIACEMRQNRQDYLVLAQARASKNLANATDISQAEADLAAASCVVLALEQELAISEHQLHAYLADTFEEPIDFCFVCPEALPAVPLPTDLPLHLLSRRPDITAQLWLIESTQCQVAVARAGFYPDINLAGFWGYQTIHTHQWFLPISQYTAAGPALTLPIYQGGYLKATLRGQEAARDTAILEYNQLVLKAVQEVLDGITRVTNSARQLACQQDVSAQQQKVAELTEQRRQHNLASIPDLLVDQFTALAARDQEIIATQNTLQAILALIKALGGGYTQ